MPGVVLGLDVGDRNDRSVYLPMTNTADDASHGPCVSHTVPLCPDPSHTVPYALIPRTLSPYARIPRRLSPYARITRTVSPYARIPRPLCVLRRLVMQPCTRDRRLDCFRHPTGGSQLYIEFKKYTSETIYNWKLP